MKKKNFIMLLILIWVSFSNSNRIYAEKLANLKNLPTKTEQKSLEESENDKKILEEKQNFINKKRQNLMDKLNQVKVYVIVSTTAENRKDDLLLSLSSEVRFDAENVLYDYRHRKLILTRTYTTKRRTVSRKNRFSIIHLVRAEMFIGVAKLYRNANFYSSENDFGYKSICPLFFDKFTAENFLLKTVRRSVLLFRGLSTESNQEILNGFSNSKIKAVPLGDLIFYLTEEKNDEILNKFEFLLVPHLSKINSLTFFERKKIKKLLYKTPLSFYQNKFLEFREELKNLENV